MFECSPPEQFTRQRQRSAIMGRGLGCTASRTAVYAGRQPVGVAVSLWWVGFRVADQVASRWDESSVLSDRVGALE